VTTYRARAAALGVLAAATLTASVACTSADRSPTPQALHLTWQDTALPAPTGERALVRAASWCAGRWVVVGATSGADDRTRPAVWTSTDARVWQSLPLHPGRDFYAGQEILSSVACSRGRLAVVGAKSGGAHGMPRTATWQERPDGSLSVVRAPFPRFGGSRAVAVSRLAGGPRGYLVTGTRTSGAAVWQSTDGAAFRLYDGAPGLASTARRRTQAADAMPFRGGWLVAGQATESDGRLRGVTWTGDRRGPWTRLDLPGGTTITTAERLVATAGGPDVAGLLDDGFGLWVLRNGSWKLTERFGSSDPDGTEVSYVSGLVDAESRLAATYSDGAHFRLWVGEDVPMPTEVAVDGDRTATLAAHGRRLLLLTDDGETGRAWLTTVPRPVL
jgi:hypothetical protein